MGPAPLRKTKTHILSLVAQMVAKQLKKATRRPPKAVSEGGRKRAEKMPTRLHAGLRRRVRGSLRSLWMESKGAQLTATTAVTATTVAPLVVTRRPLVVKKRRQKAPKVVPKVMQKVRMTLVRRRRPRKGTRS